MMIMTTYIVRIKTNGRSSKSNCFAPSYDYKMFLAMIIITLTCPCLGTLNNCPTNSNNNLGQEPSVPSARTLSVPLIQLGNKGYYVGHFFKANWYKSHQFCVVHGMRLASFETIDENRALVNYLNKTGLDQKRYWTSGTDQAEEGSFVWFDNGMPVTFTDWGPENPDNYRDNEHCLELWNRYGQGLQWNDDNCRVEHHFVCEN